MSPSGYWTSFCLLAFSFVIVGLGQPYFIPAFSVLTTIVGYALFWRALLFFKSGPRRFWLGAIWFALVQAIHLSWLTSDRYVGVFIFFLYLFLISWIGLQFGLLSLFVKKQMSIVRILALSGGWVLLEWSRLFVMTGFTWSSVGLSLTATSYSLQLASIGGIFGLSFWVILTNLAALQFLERKKILAFTMWIILILFPYGYGFFQLSKDAEKSDRTLEALLVQTALSPEEKMALSGFHFKAMHPLEQWKRILILLKAYREDAIDVIVLPEAVVPYGTDVPLYNQALVFATFKEIFGAGLPSILTQGGQEVGNGFWAQSIADFFQANVIIGLEDQSQEDQKSYNAAFFFEPQKNAQKSSKERYEKRVLVPMGEYIPFQWCKAILADYGILDSFTAGKSARVFQNNKAPIGISICYEETYGHLMRENRLKGAEMLVNITNDVWYPKSRLPMIHFYLGRLRSVENGIPLLRACNTGLTCGVDCYGRLLNFLEPETPDRTSQPGILKVSLPLKNFETIYSKFGDSLIVCMSLIFLLCAFLYRK